MKILAVGDPHGSEKIKNIPLEGVDLILITGDIGKADLARKLAFENVERRKQGLPEAEKTPADEKAIYMEIYNSALGVMRYFSKFAPTYTIYGNVEPSNSDVRRTMRKTGLSLPFLTDAIEGTSGAHLFNNRLLQTNGVRIGGLEYFVDDVWVKEFKPADYSKRLARAKKETVKAKKVLGRFGDLDILVCHQPPLGYLDQVTAPFAPKHWQGKHAGSKIILDYIKKHQPKYAFCGHIHEGEGTVRIGKTEVHNLGVCGYKLIEL